MSDNNIEIPKIIQHLYKSDEEAAAYLSPCQLEQKKRLLSLYNTWLSSPWKENSKILADHVGMFNIELSQAYRDFENVKMIFGNLKLASKDVMKYVVSEMLKHAYQQAETDKNSMAMVAAANGLIKVGRLDQIDIEIDIESLNIPDFETTVDPTVLSPDFKPMKNKAKFLEKYRGKLNEIEEAVYEETN